MDNYTINNHLLLRVNFISSKNYSDRIHVATAESNNVILNDYSVLKYWFYFLLGRAALVLSCCRLYHH